RDIESLLLGRYLEFIGNAKNGLGAAKEQHAIRTHELGHAFQNLGFRRRIKINKNVAAEHNIEAAHTAPVAEQVHGSELHHFADLFGELPLVAILLEIFHQVRDGQSALYFELVIDAKLGLIDHFA